MSNPITADMLLDVMDLANLDGPPRSYSGRFMYGRECVGIVQHDYLQLGTLLALGLSDWCTQHEKDDEDRFGYLYELNVLMGENNAKTDSMGRDVIVYWPGLEWPEGREQDEDDDEY